MKTVFADLHEGGRLGTALESLISPGCIISGGKVVRSILAYNVRINSYSLVSDSILMEGVSVGRHAQLRRCIIDEGVRIPEGMRIGFDPEADARNFILTESGIVIVPSGYHA
jgi:glucose-1-phosphate adenylyltransferase